MTTRRACACLLVLHCIFLTGCFDFGFPTGRSYSDRPREAYWRLMGPVDDVSGLLDFGYGPDDGLSGYQRYSKYARIMSSAYELRHVIDHGGIRLRTSDYYRSYTGRRDISNILQYLLIGEPWLRQIRERNWKSWTESERAEIHRVDCERAALKRTLRLPLTPRERELADSVLRPGMDEKAKAGAGEAVRRRREQAESLGLPLAMDLDVGKKTKLELVLIPAGEFLMGSAEDEFGHRPHEGPRHPVVITRPFYMGRCEVTQRQYCRVMGENPSRYRGWTKPVEAVMWGEAVEFCRRLSAKVGRAVRLPTEAEWEYACRAGSPARHFFGESGGDLREYAWYGMFYGWGVHPVGRKKPNAWGLHDMYGNAREWCSDLWDRDYYTVSPLLDPAGPGWGGMSAGRSVRGGSWASAECTSAGRGMILPKTGRNWCVGFRIVVPVDVGDKLKELRAQAEERERARAEAVLSAPITEEQKAKMRKSVTDAVNEHIGDICRSREAVDPMALVEKSNTVWSVKYRPKLGLRLMDEYLIPPVQEQLDDRRYPFKAVFRAEGMPSVTFRYDRVLGGCVKD